MMCWMMAASFIWCNVYSIIYNCLLNPIYMPHRWSTRIYTRAHSSEPTAAVTTNSESVAQNRKTVCGHDRLALSTNDRRQDMNITHKFKSQTAVCKRGKERLKEWETWGGCCCFCCGQTFGKRNQNLPTNLIYMIVNVCIALDGVYVLIRTFTYFISIIRIRLHTRSATSKHQLNENCKWSWEFMYGNQFFENGHLLYIL